MRKNMMRKNLRRTIQYSMGRFIAIVAIIAIGAAIFVGLRITKKDMVATGQSFTDRQNMFDLRLLSTCGWTQEDVDAVLELDGVTDAEGGISVDVYAHAGSGGEDLVYRIHSIPERINRVHLLGGRMPEKENECLVDGDNATDAVLGTKIYISDGNEEDTLDMLSCREYTVVGYISTPLYMDMTRGTTTLGSGTVFTYLYLPREAFDTDYYTEINVTIPGDYTVYSDAYADAMSAAADRLDPHLKPLAQNRREQILIDAREQLAEGRQEYEDGLKEFEEGRAEVLQELADALAELQKAQREIDNNRQTLSDGEQQLLDGWQQVEDGLAAITTGRLELENKKQEVYAQLAQGNEELLANYQTVTQNLRDLRNGRRQLEDGIAQIEDGIAQMESGLKQIETGFKTMDLMLGMLDSSIKTTSAALEAAKISLIPDQMLIARLENRLAEQTAQRDQYTLQRQELVDNQNMINEQLPALKQQHQDLLAQKQELDANELLLEDALAQINAGFEEVKLGKSQADMEFAAAAAQLDAGELELKAAKTELEKKQGELAAGKQALEQGQIELDEAWDTYYEGKAEAEAELSKAEADLEQAAQDLADAEKTIAEMDEAEVYILDRNTNMGYTALDSNSDIVSGVSRVFPVFFLLVAALVCITTMTRMVDEERTQIGTLKALGYSRGAIMRKYLNYALLASVLGCGLGITLGCTVFPWILWDAYGIIFNIQPQIELTVDWPLCLGVAGTYTLVCVVVTWRSCHKSLKGVPAELIRPVPPTSGKKILLEYLPFWDKISFLNKVTIRNIFRYRQRLLMMLVGIGGCTALLLTGFGLSDSVIGIADYHFAEVAVYDMSVYFSDGQTSDEQDLFREALDGAAEDVGFFYQTSVELSFNDGIRDVFLIAADDSIESFLSLHQGETPLYTPNPGDALISAGIAEIMDIAVGDTITVTDSDMQKLTVTVSGIFDNHVQNYVLLTPETVAAQWGTCPDSQVAYVKTAEGKTDGALSTIISKQEDVLSVSVNRDVADSVNSMLDALDMVIVTIVVCAGLLAVTVLYNLTNINIKERLREIATIKVLGFRAKETGAYIFKENIVLTIMGVILGIPMGILLLEFVMTQIKVDMVWFSPRIDPLSYIYAAALTLLSALLVDYVFYYKLQGINMAEALKPAE